MDLDPNTILFGPISAVIILVFLVQSLYEATEIQGRHVPLLSIAVALVMMIFAGYAPNTLVEAVANALLIASTASVLVRFVKRGQEDESTTRGTTKWVHRDDTTPARVSRSER